MTAGAAGYRQLDGTPYAGTIRFTPTVTRITSAAHGVIALGAVNATLGASGDFTVTLLATDADGFSPSGWTYRVDEEFTNAPGRAYNISLPAAAANVELSSLAPVEASTGTVSSPAVLSVNDKTGVVDLTAADVGAEPSGTSTAAVAAHSADTTGVHGINDTTALETQTGSAAKVTAHSQAADPHGDRAHVITITGPLADRVTAVESGFTSVNGYITDAQNRIQGLETGVVYKGNADVTGPLAVAGYTTLAGGQANGDWSVFGALHHLGSTAGFYGAAATSQPTVTGIRGGNEALASLLTALAQLGLIVDDTTA